MRYQDNGSEVNQHENRAIGPDKMTEQAIKQAEASKARIYITPGELNNNDFAHVERQEIDTDNIFVHSAMVDENYLLLGNHIDAVTKQKIVSGEYIEFSKLLPKDRVLSAEEGGQRMEVMNKDGHMYWVPVTESSKINNFSKWEQAFHIYSNIYSKAYPNRVTELVQYNHLIYTASLTYMWDNVYRYDVDFHLHMAAFPKRSWAIILQQAWSLRLKDKLKFTETRFSGTPSKNDDGWGNLCKRFNKGKCTFEPGCRFEHRCKYCKKFGHGIHVCRKLKMDRNNANNANSNRTEPSTVAVQETKQQPKQ